MQIVRYRAHGATGEGAARCGVLHGGRVAPVDGVTGIGELLARPLRGVRALVETAAVTAAGPTGVPVADVDLLAPADGRMEIWAAGVTYHRSKDARMEESTQADIYDRVHAAERPELFFKSAAWRAVTTGEPVRIREDSGVDVPEPELALVLNSAAELVGYAVCNDMSSRSIEGENPLYLPQAKVYAGACALSPGIRPAWEVPELAALEIRCEILRDGAPVFSGAVSAGRLVRTPAELATFLFRAEHFPEGVVLATGTGIVPELDFTLRADDEVRIVIAGVGELTNRVVLGKGEISQNGLGTIQ